MSGHTAPQTTASAATLIQLTGVTKEFRGRSGTLTAVDHVDLSIHAGEIFGVIGYSGAGKSTLVRLINALEKPTSGSVVVNGTELVGLSERKLRHIRAEIGMIFQQFNLLSSRTVAQNVAYPLEVTRWPQATRRERIMELLDFVGIADKASAYPSQLSGGQKQRVGIARALATNPHILLADEATSALDPQTTHEVLEVLRKVNQELGITIVVITHEMDVVRQLCHKVAVMEHGKVVESGDTYAVFATPQHPVTRNFVATVRHDQPSTEVIARLRGEHTGRLVTVDVTREWTASAATHAWLTYHVDAVVVYGGITDVAQQPYGSLTFLVDGAPHDLEAALAHVRAQTIVVDWGTAANPTALTSQEA